MKDIQLFIKYIFDYILGIICLILLWPIFLLIAFLIKIDSKGSVLFRQKRIGKDGRVFEILKFRTMVENAENIGDGLIVKDEKDNRITKMGRFLRKTSLDELPQLFNILNGDMSIVGPRPPVTYHPYNGYESYSDFAKKRFEMKPGITGLAQVKKRNSATWDERIIIDVEYVNNYSLWLDIKILFNTIFALFNEEEYTGA